MFHFNFVNINMLKKTKSTKHETGNYLIHHLRPNVSFDEENKEIPGDSFCLESLCRGL